ncbi:MAG: UDP-N-acetylmuramoyl-tripeptide--D-alanyl-D-alanine ligase [Candidatus Accumulibacter sp.]|nr:UDP-N-acetylmuramoyl-tripeptide--D-alanyl-D-alanine ligase [Accumulibacter sp.]
MMSLQEAAGVVNGALFGKDISFSSISTDSRTAGKGQLFVALRGESFDGHEFVNTARTRGAVAALVSLGSVIREIEGKDFPLIVVKDTRFALGQLAAYWRGKFTLPVIAVTGSNGKTTTKEMIASILRVIYDGDVLATEGNLNNEIGLPLTLLGLNERHRAVVVEMGMSRPGEILALAEIAQPTVAIVTNAQRAHLEGMESLEAVAAEKGSVYSGMRKSGVAVINADDQYHELWLEQSAGRRIVRFSFEQAVEVVGFHAARAPGNTLGIRSGNERIEVKLMTPGKHNAYNALAAAAATLAAGADLSVVRDGLMAFRGVRRRLQQRNALKGATLFDDTYNANPDSVRAGIDVLAAESGKKVLVLGDMGETGKMAPQFHEEIGIYAKNKGVDVLLTLGDWCATAARVFGEGGQHFEKDNLLIDALKMELASQTLVLVKGSRFMRMERIADAIAVPDAVPGEK